MSDKNWAIAVWALYLAAYFTFAVTAVIGLIIAYVKRESLAPTPFESHMTSAIRTFWITLIVGVIGSALSVIGVGIILLLLLAIWNLFRCVRGLVAAISEEPIASPKGWL